MYSATPVIAPTCMKVRKADASIIIVEEVKITGSLLLERFSIENRTENLKGSHDNRREKKQVTAGGMRGLGIPLIPSSEARDSAASLEMGTPIT